ncbi:MULTISPECIES: ABC transporter ATP-binding protein [unclassified Meiothermus]|uniref:ABC transporter ATP-binding protein n=1 Tax=unclassified Meiothermus TaxID=370471 RepID=UPI000D7C9BCB|nr:MULTISPECIES: ABC transporter ATP-binding protein [unclassified Meiothermus]PZA07693.1 ABC transporter ATP-binding protein [Meiothermus sp. Pnk-1]RYM34495.1 ABC transporter ATP-binding protein [Meiothermus sp. PNK-Is4]
MSLEVRGLHVARGQAPVVRGVSFSAPPGEVTALLGPNGAGKTTLLEALSGILPAQRGEVWLLGVRVERASRVARSRAGLAHVEQGRSVFPGLTVEENLWVGARAGLEEAFRLFPELEKRRRVLAGRLSGGEQQMLVLARALLGRPRVLLLDEMSLGLAPLVVRRLIGAVEQLAQAGLAVLLVEQFAPLALGIAQRALVMSQGRLVYSGPAQGLLREPELLQEAYLGRLEAKP